MITTSPSNAALPGTLTVGLARGRHELRCFFRSKEALLFTLAFPVMLLVLFGAIFGSDDVIPGIPYSQVLVAGIMASGLASVTFVSLAIGVAAERDSGDLKRLAATPMPKLAYFIGKTIQVLVTMTLELALILAVGVALYNVSLPSTLGRWFTFVWVTVLGAIATSLLGIAMSSVPKNAKAAAPIVNLPFVAIQFLSGVFVNFSDLSPTLRGIASLFPLKWIAQGYRSVFLPTRYLKVEPGGSWQHGTMALVLGAWAIGGALLCVRTFRWGGRDK
jgi:ABC-2 type transport system permease protein